MDTNKTTNNSNSNENSRNSGNGDRNMNNNNGRNDIGHQKQQQQQKQQTIQNVQNIICTNTTNNRNFTRNKNDMSRSTSSAMNSTHISRQTSHRSSPNRQHSHSLSYQQKQKLQQYQQLDHQHQHQQQSYHNSPSMYATHFYTSSDNECIILPSIRAFSSPSASNSTTKTRIHPCTSHSSLTSSPSSSSHSSANFRSSSYFMRQKKHQISGNKKQYFYPHHHSSHRHTHQSPNGHGTTNDMQETYNNQQYKIRAMSAVHKSNQNMAQTKANVANYRNRSFTDNQRKPPSPIEVEDKFSVGSGKIIIQSSIMNTDDQQMQFKNTNKLQNKETIADKNIRNMNSDIIIDNNGDTELILMENDNTYVQNVQNQHFITRRNIKFSHAKPSSKESTTSITAVNTGVNTQNISQMNSTSISPTNDNVLLPNNVQHQHRLNTGVKQRLNANAYRHNTNYSLLLEFEKHHSLPSSQILPIPINMNVLQKPCCPIKVLAFDLDKTMVRTISLQTDEQPQPEQFCGGYFMFFDYDTSEYHHVFKRPGLDKLIAFLTHIKNQNILPYPVMLCTHGTYKYAQTILRKCKAEHLFPIMLPRRDWYRRQFEDDPKQRRFKTLARMASHVNVNVCDILMVDDDMGVYCKKDRCSGSLLHIKPFDDPSEQRDDQELYKLMHFLDSVLKYGKYYYIQLFANCVKYTGLVKSTSNNSTTKTHNALFRSQIIQILILQFQIKFVNNEEKVVTVYLFDRYVSRQPIDWDSLNSNNLPLSNYVILMFVCLFIGREYLYTDRKRPKQFRRYPFSSKVWLDHINIYEEIIRTYKSLPHLMDTEFYHQEQQSQMHTCGNKHKIIQKNEYNTNNVSEYEYQRNRSKNKHKNKILHPSIINIYETRKLAKDEQNKKCEHKLNASTTPWTPSTSETSADINVNTCEQQNINNNLLPALKHTMHITYYKMFGDDYIPSEHGFFTAGGDGPLNENTISSHIRCNSHRLKKHKRKLKEIFFNQIYQLRANICDVVGYPKLLHGLFDKQIDGYDTKLFHAYEQYVLHLFYVVECNVRRIREQQQ